MRLGLPGNRPFVSGCKPVRGHTPVVPAVRMLDMRRPHRDFVVGLRMAEIDHFVDRQKPGVERSWARAFWPHTHTLALRCRATEGTGRLRLRFDEQELASGAGLMRVRDAVVACKARPTPSTAAPFRALRLYSRREFFHRTAI